MLLESLLAYAHISAVLLLAVFLSSKIALMRPEVLKGRPLLCDRLLRLDVWSWGSFGAVAASGLARMAWGAKGWHWYAGQPLLWTKLALFALMLAMALPARRALLRWRHRAHHGISFADDAEIRAQRRWLMWQAHVMVILPLLGALLAYGF